MATAYDSGKGSHGIVENTNDELRRSNCDLGDGALNGDGDFQDGNWQWIGVQGPVRAVSALT